MAIPFTEQQLRALDRIEEHRALVVTDVRSPLQNGGIAEFTLCARDATGLFSYLSGILGARGFNILGGEIRTTDQGFAVDSIRGTVAAAVLAEVGGFDRWIEALEEEMCRVLAPLHRNPPDPAAVRDAVVERVAAAVEPSGKPSPWSGDGSEPLLPISIEITDEGPATRITVDSQDTAFFLYSLSSALAMQDISIRQVEIDTHQDRIRDVFHVTTGTGKPVTDPADRRRLQLSILVTKQFSHFLYTAADPLGAFSRFEELVRQVAQEGADRRLQQLLADPEAQAELARLLGASDFLWEDFIRLQYESLLPLLRDAPSRPLLSTRSQDLERTLEEQLRTAATRDERRAVLNRFKDHESYLIDADHILQRNTDFFFLSHRLTRLAEVVVSAAFRIGRAEMEKRYGTPRTAAGLAADYAVFGLGKMGGSALGYASDIELIILYSDHGETDGGGESSRCISNREFFERLVVEATDLVEAKREGIFRIDLRLRPYGEDGPRAVHIESFIEYFGPAGKAHSAERLALIRLRPVAGDSELGRRVVAIRDQLVYESGSISTEEIRDLRRRQAEEKVTAGRYNAKFSPGALVDLEYNVQLLQVAQGRNNRDLRNPGIHSTLQGLSEEGAIDEAEAESMIRAYRFLRNLINGLRMLRGNAQDLFLPEFGTSEYLHLARRMGYRNRSDLTAAEQLRIDFEVETASVRGFVERHLGQDALPSDSGGNPADLVLSDTLSEELSTALLATAGFQNPARGVANLRRMAGEETRETFARLLVLAWDYLTRSSDPDMALNNWERFTEQVGDRDAFFRQLLGQPRRMEIMLRIFAGSQFLSETLIRDPVFLEWISDPRVVTEPQTQQQMEAELRRTMEKESDRTGRLNGIRRFRKREILRIGTRDICLAGRFGDTVRELSALARAVVQVALEQAVEELPPEEERQVGRFCILAFGKLGGDELNYSSDIDLLAIYEPREDLEGQERLCSRLFRQVVRDISDFTRDGRAYRVDLRLRPWGNAGRLVYALDTILRYYETEADLWELQAMIKLAPIAGDHDLGRDFLERARPGFTRRLKRAGRDRILQTVRTLRQRALEQYAPAGGSDVKNGSGGIRDIEFLLQALQMLHQHLYPELLTGNTMTGLMHLEEAGIMEPETVERLRDDYRFLRRVEHFLQVYEDRQLHAIPTEPRALAKLARIVMEDSPAEHADIHQGTAALLTRLEETLSRVRREYLRVTGSPGGVTPPEGGSD
ncbi:MAG: glutamate-ammonia-ligase adenylyltransferase [Spirochaetaceae bacterium]|nr:MAG: glutamate-ammonia-ligase adenylyltransferase [Spirochaetaceae bacterium]